jgi:hypothetical protein
MLDRAKVNNNIKNGEEPSTGGLSDDIHDVLAEWSTDPSAPKAAPRVSCQKGLSNR